MAKAGVNLFVEKPLSVRPAAEVAELAHQLKLIQDKNKSVQIPNLLVKIFVQIPRMLSNASVVLICKTCFSAASFHLAVPNCASPGQCHHIRQLVCLPAFG